MTKFRIFIILILLIASTKAFAADSSEIDRLINEAIGHNLIAGGVVLVGNREGVIFQRPYGRTSPQPDAPLTSVTAIFDLASLTKVVATAPSILKLAEAGRLSLTDPVVKWFPELSGHGKDEILILHLLTHTSGLDDVPLSGPDPLAAAIKGAAEAKLKGETGNRFHYADLNFILLAELVRRATGAPLDVYARASFYRPLGMNDTSFLPEHKERCAKTLSEDGLLTGQPQDRVCRQLGGVAGHAGLFSTATDLARFARMILTGGVLDGKQVLEPRTVLRMTAPYFSRNGQVVRGLGWDIDSPYSSPRGGGFSKSSFGHTGFAGSSIWIDPAADTFVVFLTTRVDYARVKEFNRLRGALSTVACRLFGVPAELAELGIAHDE